MANALRTTSGINNLDIVYMQTVINNVLNRLNTTAVLLAQDVQDIAWLYNSLAQHTHTYYDYKFIKYGNVNQTVYEPGGEEVRYNASNHVQNWSSLNNWTGAVRSAASWKWNGATVATTAYNVTATGSYRRGAFIKTEVTQTSNTAIGNNPDTTSTLTSDYYQIISAGRYVTYSSTIGANKITPPLDGYTLFQKSGNLAAGNISYVSIINELAVLINSIRSHTHVITDDTI